MNPPIPVTRVAWSVKDWAAAVSVSRVTVHRLIKADIIRSKLMGRKRLILTTPEEYVAGLDASNAAIAASSTTVVEESDG